MKNTLLLGFVFILLIFPQTIKAEELPPQIDVIALEGDHSFKSYMSYQSITKVGSPQHELQQIATTDENGVRVVDDRALVAIGTGYDAPVGSDIDVVLETGVVVPCKVGDIKEDRHTDGSNMYDKTNGNAVEFIVDTKNMDSEAKRAGNMSVIDEYAGNVVGVIKR